MDDDATDDGRLPNPNVLFFLSVYIFVQLSPQINEVNTLICQTAVVRRGVVRRPHCRRRRHLSARPSARRPPVVIVLCPSSIRCPYRRRCRLLSAHLPSVVRPVVVVLYPPSVRPLSAPSLSSSSSVGRLLELAGMM